METTLATSGPVKCGGCGSTADMLGPTWGTVTVVISDPKGQIYRPKGYYCPVCREKNYNYDMFDALAFIHGYRAALNKSFDGSELPKLLDEFEAIAREIGSKGCQMNTQSERFWRMAEVRAAILGLASVEKLRPELASDYGEYADDED